MRMIFIIIIEMIAIPKQEAISLSETMGMHPEMNSLIPLWEDGKMGIIQKCGI